MTLMRAFEFQPNASSGMGVAEHSKNTFMELKQKKVHRYVIFKVDEKKREVVVEKTGGPAESYDDFTASLPENDCRYAVFDFDFVTSENCQKSKIFFIAWLVCPRIIQSIVIIQIERNTITLSAFNLQSYYTNHQNVSKTCHL